MKKLLSLLGAIGLVATSGATVVSCDNGDKDSTNTGDFTADFSSWTSETDVKDAIKANFSDNEDMKDETLQIMLFDSIDDANKAKGILGGNGETDMPTFNAGAKKIKDLETISFLAMTGEGPTAEDPAATVTIVLEGTITNKPADETTGITLDNSDVTVAPKGTVTVKVSNFADLKGVAAVSDDEDTATAVLDDDTITITGVADGKTTVTVSATGVESVKINVTVQSNDVKPVISVDNTNVSVVAAATAKVKVSNFADLKGVAAVSDDEDTATAVLDDDTITITGVVAGKTTITVSATNADNVVINVTVTAAA
jgi:hypothetical protein